MEMTGSCRGHGSRSRANHPAGPAASGMRLQAQTTERRRQARGSRSGPDLPDRRGVSDQSAHMTAVMRSGTAGRAPWRRPLDPWSAYTTCGSAVTCPAALVARSRWPAARPDVDETGDPALAQYRTARLATCCSPAPATATTGRPGLCARRPSGHPRNGPLPPSNSSVHPRRARANASGF